MISLLKIWVSRVLSLMLTVTLRKLALEDTNGFYLNWAPGPMPTRMFDYMKGTVINDPESSQTDIDLWQNMKLIDLSVSAKVLLKLLSSETRCQYNGKHVDFFDINEDEL